ncbi:DUF3696 domain-containing protein [Burkholderia sp. LAS2]|uniref:AAA family ATPase n=1 Tax=Burkholderia sp. LAS2 TaxID=2813843 RepID=UPI001BD0D6CC|nr:DUF3696 domain-containing protein [Burkholderia sp. LAS2]QVN10282.1 DUF3696 domain-containing protein [Burkholderia sp. LAS2]
MKSLGLTNIRSLKETGVVDLAPITLLLGQNSSGKSTFLRTFALFKQALGVRAREPFLWVGELVDFGGFSETLSTFSETEKVSVLVKFDLPLNTLLQQTRAVSINRPIPKDQHDTEFTVTITEFSGKDGDSRESFGYEFKFDRNVIEFKLSSDGIFERFEINGRNSLNLMRDWIGVREWNGPIPTLTRFSSPETLDEARKKTTFQTTLLAFIASRMDGRSRDERHYEVLYRLLKTPFNNLLRTVKSTDIGDAKWRRAAHSWTEASPAFVELQNLVIGFRFPELTAYIFDYFSFSLENMKYITPLRASAERYYRKQGLAVNELDPRGTNFALFLDNMSIEERHSFAEWTRKFFGVSIQISPEQGGHLSLMLRSIDETAKDFNIADTGFGFSQMFPILAQLWAVQNIRSNRKSGRISAPVIFAIEQPELHLHPRLQAQLANVFVDAVVAARTMGIDLRVIVETHSEYLVNRLGALISKKKIPADDASVLIFEKQSVSSPTEIRQSTFSDKGYLKNWPHGFFEPA